VFDVFRSDTNFTYTCISVTLALLACRYVKYYVYKVQICVCDILRIRGTDLCLW